MITREMLAFVPSGRNKDAFENVLGWFDEKFPAGTAAIEDVWAACPNSDWRLLFALNFLPISSRAKLAWRIAGQAIRFADAESEFADNVTPETYYEASIYAAHITDRYYSMTTAEAIVATTDALNSIGTYTAAVNSKDYDAQCMAAATISHYIYTASYAAAFAAFFGYEAARAEQRAWAWQEVMRVKKRTEEMKESKGENRE